MNIFNIIRVIFWIFAIILWWTLLSEINISFYATKYSNLMPVIEAILTGLITWVAMWFIDNQAKKRWTQEGYLKRKIELEIEIRKILLQILEKINILPSTTELEPYKNKSINDSDWDFMNNLNGKINDLCYDYSSFPNRINFDEIKNMYKKTLELTMEYSIFNKQVENYEQWLKSIHIEHRIIKNFSRNDFDVNKNKIREIIETCYNFRNNTDKLLEIINQNIPQ